MIDQFINFVIRPPRAEYNPDLYLWEKDFTLAGRKYKREDLELRNERGHTLMCSHYVPSQFPEDSPLPCVVYCHGNSGCRADANEAAVVLLPSNITVFTLDFSGSGLSDGDYVSLGWHEKNDLKVVLTYLRTNEKVSRIGLWGRSMGAVTSLLYGAEDPSIAGMVLDSAFSNLFDLMLELADVYKIRLPKFTVKMAVKYMRMVIQKKAKFDIKKLDCIQVAPKTFIPTLFGHAKDDKFIQSQHSDAIFNSYAGDKNILKFEGDHNSSRPQFYYDSVSIFFYNVLRPPRTPSPYSSVEENMLYEIIAGFRNMSAADAPSSSADIAPVDNDVSANEDSGLLVKEKSSGENECCSYTSSNRESWGRCSSLGSDGPSAEGTSGSNSDKATVKVLGTDVVDSRRRSTLGSSRYKVSKKKKRVSLGARKLRRDKFEKLEAFGRRIRICILKKVSHRRQCLP